MQHKIIPTLSVITAIVILAAGACKRRSDLPQGSTAAVVAPVAPTVAENKPESDEPFLAEVHVICRSDPDGSVQATVNALYAKGLTYKGVLNGSGIDCNRVLFTNSDD